MEDTPSSPPQRLSRYRSQRRAQQQSQAEEAPAVPALPQPQGSPVDDGVVRSKSRYHRKNAEGRPSTARAAEPRDQEQFEVPIRQTTKSQSPPAQIAKPVTGYVSQRNQTRPAGESSGDRHASPPVQLGAQDLRQARSYESGPEPAIDRRPQMNGHGTKRDPGAVAVPSRPPMPASQLSGELFPPPRPVVAKPISRDGPPTSDKIQATKSVSQLPQFVDSDDGGGGCFGLFKRKRGEASPGVAEKMPTSRSRQTGNGPQTIKPGGGGIVPGTDAPVSAVNAGDRRVLVECGKSKTIFPVTPATTPVDLIKSAANVMSERINVKSAVLLEDFGSVGVQRPLRRYEHIRDVMNSWDTDRQNSLLLVDPGTGSSEAELSIAGVPQEKPDETTWLLWYSQKVGKWDKRFITLKSDGQITQQREANKNQQQENICHLSDFDIYTPTPEKLRKKIKPPKKICYAIKSQQKTSMFESTQNFVHFFCSADRRTADEFYAAVQGWRSWYLVNVMGEGRKPKPKDDEGAPSGVVKGHRPGESFDSHYQLGSFKPLIDMDRFDERPGTSGSANAGPSGFAKSASQFDTTIISPERRASTSRRKQYPPGSLANRAQLAEDEPLANLNKRTSMDQKRMSLDQSRQKSDEFASTGLLGRTYSQRQREHTERENDRPQAFTNGPNLLNGGYDVTQDDYVKRQSLDAPLRNHSTKVKHAHKTTSSSEMQRNKSTRNRGSVDLGRSSSTRVKEPPKPLIDLTPQYREPPQHLKKGKGHHPDELGPGGLIDSATSPEDPLGIPPSTDWRGRNAHAKVNGVHEKSSRARSMSRPGQRPATSRSPDGHEAFTGEGLLAGRQQGWGGGDKGRGYMDGSRAKGPMLDVNEPSKFVQGSLLNRVEKDRGRDGPVIDRSHGEEREIKYGEGY